MQKITANIFFSIIFATSMLWMDLVFAGSIIINDNPRTNSISASVSTSSQALQTAPNASSSPNSQDKEGMSKFFEESNFSDFEKQLEAKPFVIPGGKKHEP